MTKFVIYFDPNDNCHKYCQFISYATVEFNARNSNSKMPVLQGSYLCSEDLIKQEVDRLNAVNKPEQPETTKPQDGKKRPRINKNNFFKQ